VLELQFPVAVYNIDIGQEWRSFEAGKVTAGLAESNGSLWVYVKRHLQDVCLAKLEISSGLYGPRGTLTVPF